MDEWLVMTRGGDCRAPILHPGKTCYNDLTDKRERIMLCTGVDIIEVSRIDKAVGRWGKRFFN
ncbi:MAG: hypothetical protein GX631_06785, partial [Dehalococcoidales bacterium]|nr:hypothetical protein [Dehalococcoidales bacterium]